MKNKLLKILLITMFVMLVFSVLRVNASRAPDEVLDTTVFIKETIYTIEAYVCNFGVSLSFVEPIILLIITLIKKYDWKIFKRTLLLAIFLFISSYIPKTMVSLGGGFENVRRIEPTEIMYYIAIIIILEIVTIIYPIYAIKKLNKQISLKGENKNV